MIELENKNKINEQNIEEMKTNILLLNKQLNNKEIELDDYPRDVGENRYWVLDIIVRVTNPGATGVEAGFHHRVETPGGTNGMEVGFHQELQWDGIAGIPDHWIGDPTPKKVF